MALIQDCNRITGVRYTKFYIAHEPFNISRLLLASCTGIDERFYKLHCKSDRVWTRKAKSAAVVDLEPLRRDELGRPEELYEWSSDSDADAENEKPRKKDLRRRTKRRKTDILDQHLWLPFRGLQL